MFKHNRTSLPLCGKDAEPLANAVSLGVAHGG